MQENGEVANASKEQTRAGSKALMLLADPLTVRVLRTHLDRPLRFSDLEAILGWAPVTTLRAAVNSLRCVGALKRSALRQMPYRVENELTGAGCDLILVANALERFDGLVSLAETGVEVSNGIGDGEFLGVSFEDFFILPNGILQFALLDELLRSAESLLFVEAKTERHMLADSRSGPPPTRNYLPWEARPTGWPSDRPCLPII